MSDRNLNAYYYGFNSTGNDAIDAILEAVARAGKAYHHTGEWDEPWELYDEGGPSFTDVMQERAQSAADRLAKLEDGIRALAKECEIRGENGKEAQFKDDPTAEESVRRAANKRLAGKLRALLDGE